MNPHQKLAIRALERMRGEDSARARAAFRGMTKEQMGEQFGESGQTRAEVLACYESNDAKVDDAIKWVQSQTA